MANYHLTTKMIKRKSGHSSVAGAAYRAHENIKDERTNVWHKYATRSGIVQSEIFTPADSPEWAKDRSQLWNAVEKFEKRVNSQTAQEIEVSLPLELTFEENLELARDFVNNHIVNHPTRGGRVADMSIHYEEENPHAHILITTRKLDGDTFNSHKANPHMKGAIQELKELREEWADVQNKHLALANHEVTVDHRSLQAQEINREPTIHLGKEAKALEDKGVESERGKKNRLVEQSNLLTEFAEDFQPDEYLDKEIEEPEEIMVMDSEGSEDEKFLQNDIRNMSFLDEDRQIGRFARSAAIIQKIAQKTAEFTKTAKNAIFDKFCDIISKEEEEMKNYEVERW